MLLAGTLTGPDTRLGDFMLRNTSRMGLLDGQSFFTRAAYRVDHDTGSWVLRDDVDPFLAKLSATGTVLDARDYGGHGEEHVAGLAVAEGGWVYLSGWVDGHYNATFGTHKLGRRGVEDAFLVKVRP
jgi:hypothetical protein